MTLVSEIISDAYRLSNITRIGSNPTSAQETEGLRYLNRIVKAVFGYEVGEPFIPFPIGDNGITRPSEYPGWTNTPSGDWFVPKNIRVMLNLSAPVDLYLHPEPDDGSRFAALDVIGNLSTNNVTIHGNGRLIEGATTLTLDTDSYNAEWFYRADTGNWVKYADLTTTDTFPFPTEFDDYFVITLAIRLNPAYGAGLDPQSQIIYNRAKGHLTSRYYQKIEVGSELGLVRMGKVDPLRDTWGYYDVYYDDNAIFNRGIPFW